MKRTRFGRDGYRLITRSLHGAATSAILALVLATGSASAKPNILFILADDVGAEAFGCYGGTSYSTPRIDTLASQGVRFTHVYANPLCTPSRVELLTGKYNFRNYESFSWLSTNETNFAQVLRNAGYRTAIAGKWQLSKPLVSGVGVGEPQAPNITAAIMRDGYGFDQYSLWQLNDPNGYTTMYWNPNYDQNGVSYPSAGWNAYFPDMNVAFLTNFMAQAVSDNVPFLAYLTLTMPHDPWVITPDSTIGSSQALKTTSNTNNFPDNIAYLDKIVGRLLDKLDALGIRDNTLVIFTGDNGTHPLISSQTTSGPVTGNKGYGTEYGTHVPFIVDWGAKITPSVSGRLVDFTDIFPTFLSASETPKPAGLLLDGKPIFGPEGAVGEDKSLAYLWYDCKKPNETRFTTAEWARDSKYKLYVDGSFFDITLTPLELSADNIAVGTGSPEAEAARAELQVMLDYYASEQGGGTTLPYITISVPDATASEAGSSTAVVRVTRTGDTAQALAVSYGIAAGTTVSAADYNATAFTGTVTIAAGSAYAELTLVPVDDADVESTEYLNLNFVTNSSALYLISGTSTASLSISDNDIAPVVPVAPIVTGTTLPAAGVDTAYNASLIGLGLVTDANLPDDVLTFTKVSGPAWMTIATNGVITGTPDMAARQASPQSVTIRVVDQGGLSTQAVFSVAITGFLKSKLDFHDDFESYAVGNLPNETNGWTTAQAADAKVVATNTSADYSGVYPMPSSAHTKVLSTAGTVVQNFYGTETNRVVWFDSLVQFAPSGDNLASIAVTNNAQLLLVLNSNRHPAVLHSIDPGGSVYSNQWTILTQTTITSGEWVRVTIGMSYTNATQTRSFFDLKLNGVAMTNALAYASPADAAPSAAGRWFLCANQGAINHNLQKITLLGQGLYDDVVVTGSPSAETLRGTVILVW